MRNPALKKARKQSCFRNWMTQQIGIHYS